MNALPSHLQFGTHAIRCFATGEFDLAPEGRKAVVLNVPGPTGEPSDLVAWFVDDPWKWWLRHGIAPILGSHMVERAQFLGCPLTVFSTPQSWLFSKGKGACVLRWNIELSLHFGAVDRIIADTPALAARINVGLGRGHRIATILQPVRPAHVG